METIHKTIRREVARKGISQVITINLTIYTAEEAIRLYNMGYLDETTLRIIGVSMPEVPEKGSVGYNVAMRDLVNKAIREYFGYDLILLVSKCRKGQVVFARQLAIWLLCQLTTFTLAQIGKAYNGSDHTKAIHSRDVINGYLSQKGYCVERDTINDFLSRYEFEL